MCNTTCSCRTEVPGFLLASGWRLLLVPRDVLGSERPPTVSGHGHFNKPAKVSPKKTLLQDGVM